MATRATASAAKVLTPSVVASLRSLNRCAFYVTNETPIRDALTKTIGVATA
eukprot:CAMPEP_0174861840 /NCGR_PEP_ID=MMETSP1114-20130205/52594_1 /TAXON_ID=312471 /ORGANISM="Neobodo designis, Strain CCAP 1951/1" /LENGTH=50 /DNA_ID=CAMNT_0016096863 /DNA_START=45 /DNA_END=194 /DNA_ORIENTATION=+